MAEEITNLKLIGFSVEVETDPVTLLLQTLPNVILFADTDPRRAMATYLVSEIAEALTLPSSRARATIARVRS